jgi:hypothetical protein
MENGYATASDGAVTVDSNTGSTDDLQQELASEVSVVEADGRRSSKAAEPTLTVDDAEAGGGAAPVESREAAPAGKGKRQSIQARIDAITAEKYTTARERDAAVKERDTLREELAALKAGKADGKVEPAAGEAGKAAAETTQPVPKETKVGGVDVNAAKFPKYAEWLQQGNDGELEDWVDARDAWKDARAAATAAIESERREQSTRFTAVAATFNERMAPVLEADPKFYERIDPRLTDTPAMSALPKGTKPTLANFLVEQVIKSEHPKELMEHLSDKTVVQRIATLQPGDIIRELTKFELTLGGATERKSGPVAGASDDDDDEVVAAAASSISRAHPPAKPVRGSSHEHVSPDDEPGEDASDDEWYRWQKKQDAKAARA